MTAEEFIKDCTRHCANDIVGWDKNGLPLYHEWLTPDQALRAVEMAREEAARQLNIDVLTLDRWIEKYGLK